MLKVRSQDAALLAKQLVEALAVLVSKDRPRLALVILEKKAKLATRTGLASLALVMGATHKQTMSLVRATESLLEVDGPAAGGAASPRRKRSSSSAKRSAMTPVSLSPKETEKSSAVS